MAKGIPNGAPATVIVSAIPTIINPTPNIAANTRPVMFSTRANKSHSATKGHKNHDAVFLADIAVPI